MCSGARYSTKSLECIAEGEVSNPSFVAVVVATISIIFFSALAGGVVAFTHWQGDVNGPIVSLSRLSSSISADVCVH